MVMSEAIRRGCCYEDSAERQGVAERKVRGIQTGIQTLGARKHKSEVAIMITQTTLSLQITRKDSSAQPVQAISQQSIRRENEEKKTNLVIPPRLPTPTKPIRPPPLLFLFSLLHLPSSSTRLRHRLGRSYNRLRRTSQWWRCLRRRKV